MYIWQYIILFVAQNGYMLDKLDVSNNFAGRLS